MFIEQAFKVQNDWWRYLLGLIVIFIGWQLIGVIPLIIVAFMKSGSIENFIKATDTGFIELDINSNLFLVLIIFSFAMGLLGIWIVVRFLHEQKFKDVTTVRAKVDWSRIRFSFLLMVIVNLGLFALMYYIEPEIYQFQFNAVPFFILVAISLFLLPLQTSFEEYLFRGYLMQGLGMLLKNKWAPLVITSVSFGLLHSFNPEVTKLGNILMIFYIGTGFLLGIMTLMDEGIELALGFHAANNMIAAVLVTTDWSALQTEALFLDISEPSGGWDIVLPIVIQYPIILWIIAKKYSWYGWKDKLFGKVYPEEIGNDDPIEII